MKTFKKILVPTDFSDGAAAAYSYAQKVAEKYGAKIDFIHIIPLGKYLSESIKKLGVPFDMDKDLFPHIIDEAEHQMKELMNDYIREGNRGEVLARVDRKPSEAIAETAKSQKYDMVIMGARGRHDTEILKGNITEKVIRYSKVPVLSVDKEMPSGGVKRILMPTDTSEVSFLSLPWVLSVAEVFDAEITLFHVIELYGTLSENIPHDPGESEISVIYDSILNGIDDFLKKTGADNVRLERGEEEFEDQLVVSDDGSSRTIPLHTHITKGVSAHYEIETFARENADLVVMTTHGRTGLAHIFLGSTTEKVAQYGGLPVLTVRPAEKHLNEE